MAMRALTLAWTEGGGQVMGLAPSAAAAAVLGEQTGIRADTLAKLTWSLDHGELPDWAAVLLAVQSRNRRSDRLVGSWAAAGQAVDLATELPQLTILPYDRRLSGSPDPDRTGSDIRCPVQ
jgi:hypothetical protein